MTKKARSHPSGFKRPTPQERVRIEAKRGLERAVRREKDIQRLAKQLMRELEKSNDRIQVLIGALVARQESAPEPPSYAEAASR